ncbi:hypothetical protein GCM10010405_44740 [Streptomyces macrosporus]|uniref:Uncharacterized protein n=1 Tax=Streptomyces macrosporus TaxID=44032 RepID=A0ABP5XNW8_9ACTN
MPKQYPGVTAPQNGVNTDGALLNTSAPGTPERLPDLLQAPWTRDRNPIPRRAGTAVVPPSVRAPGCGGPRAIPLHGHRGRDGERPSRPSDARTARRAGSTAAYRY